MSYDALLARLSAAKGRDIPQVVCNAIMSLFDEMGDKEARKIVSQLEQLDNLPSNIYGVIKRMWNETKSLNDSKILNSEKWVAKDQCVTSEEFNVFFQIHTEINLWHELGLLERNRDGIEAPLGVLDWKHVGCPFLWSPAWDHFMQGYLKAHSLPGDGCLQFLKKYLETLQATRKEREPVKK